LGAYIAGNYIEYRVAMSQVRVLDDGVPFLVYFDARARQSTFGTSNPDAFAPGTSSTLGGWGYAFVLSEMLGFALGSIVPLFGLKKANYCATCQRYLHGSKAAWVPLGLSPREARRQKRVCKKSPRELMGCRTEDDVVRAANQVMGTIWKGIEEDDPALVREALNPYRTKLNARRCLRWATLKIEVCSGCDEGVLTIYESVHQDGQVTKQLRSAFQVSKVIAAAIRA
jgi:hypothetical protein